MSKDADILDEAIKVLLKRENAATWAVLVAYLNNAAQRFRAQDEASLFALALRTRNSLAAIMARYSGGVVAGKEANEAREVLNAWEQFDVSNGE